MGYGELVYLFDMNNANDDVAKAIRRIFSAPAAPDKIYSLTGTTYPEIYGTAAALARHLPGDCRRVCLFSEEKGLYVAAVMAALSKGFSLILPYALSEGAIEEIHRVSPFDAVISDQKISAPSGVPVLSPEPADLPLPPLHPDFSPDQTFLYFFTGGSTGSPKIWSKTVRNLFAESLNLCRYFSFEAEDRFLSTVPPYHIYGFLFTVLAPFLAGAAVIADIPTFPEEIRERLERERPTVLVSVPMHYRVLNRGRIPKGGLRIAFSSAGKLEPHDGDYFTRSAGVPIYEIYGSTETGGIAHRCRARGEEALTPFDPIEWRIEKGRLRVRSDYISPEIETDEAGFFLTGDRVRPSGEKGFVLEGRADGIVKVGGKRVDTEAIREVLMEYPGVRDACVLAHEVEAGRETEMVAAVEGAVDTEPLREYMGGRLAPYALPRQIRTVAQLPRKPTGKVDRDAVFKLFFG